MSKEAMKLALEALEWNMGYLPSYGDGTRMAINAITALREALAEQPAQQALDKMAENARELGLDYEPAPMSQPNRAIAYSAASKLRELGYEWVADAWKQPAQQQEPYGYVSTHTSGLMHFNKTFHGVYRDTATEIVAVYTTPPAQRKPLTDKEQIAEALRRHGLTLIKTASGYDVLKLGQINAHGIKENT